MCAGSPSLDSYYYIEPENLQLAGFHKVHFDDIVLVSYSSGPHKNEFCRHFMKHFMSV